MKKFSVLTLGCKVNQSESDIIEGNLIEIGHSPIPLSENPDYCIVNTCSVTARSDYQSRQLIRRALRATEQVIVTGCYAQLRPDAVRNIDKAIRIVENRNKDHIANLIEKSAGFLSAPHAKRARPTIKIQDGCNNSCSYCIVPLARGRSRSVSRNDILHQIRSLEERGYNEVVLTGIQLGSYGKDFDSQQSLTDLIGHVLEKSNIRRIRLSSICVNDIDDTLLDMLHNERICNHLHIPLQSGDESILKRMGRRYTAATYREKVSHILKNYPGISIGTDVIVGFPGETDTSFQHTIDLIKDIPFSYIHIFPFSARPRSAAFRFPDHVSLQVIKKRCAQLHRLNIMKKQAFIDSHIGKTLATIIEEEDTEFAMLGTSSNYLKIRVYTNRYHKKSLVAVRVVGREGNLLRGIPVKEL